MKNILISATALSALLPTLASAHGYGMMDEYMGYGYGYGGHALGWLWIILLILVIVLIVSFARRSIWGKGHHMHMRGFGDSKSALDILKERLAKGEVGKEEFDDLKRKLEE